MVKAKMVYGGFEGIVTAASENDAVEQMVAKYSEYVVGVCGRIDTNITRACVERWVVVEEVTVEKVLPDELKG